VVRGIPARIGYARRAPWASTHVLPYNKKEGEKQEAEYLFELLGFFGVTPPERSRLFSPSPTGRPFFRELAPVPQNSRGPAWIVLNLSASDVTKMWPAERFAELVTRLQRIAPVFYCDRDFEDRPSLRN